MKEKITGFYAYHGTTKTCAEKILSSRKILSGTPRDDHWLGKGSYFFREDATSAKLWAENKIQNNVELAGEEPYVIESKIDVTSENFLNLDTRTGMNRFKQHILDIERKSSFNLRDKKSPREKVAAKARSFFISSLPPEIWVVQRTFKVDSMYDSITPFKVMDLRLQGVQVCVRDSRAILEDTIDFVFPPRPTIIRQARKNPRFVE